MKTLYKARRSAPQDQYRFRFFLIYMMQEFKITIQLACIAILYNPLVEIIYACSFKGLTFEG